MPSRGWRTAEVARVKRLVIPRALWLILIGWLTLLPAAAQPVVLGAHTRSVDAWPAVRQLSDPSQALTLEKVLERRADFTVPGSPHANLGPRQEAVWLRLPVLLDATAPRRCGWCRKPPNRAGRSTSCSPTCTCRTWTG